MSISEENRADPSGGKSGASPSGPGATSKTRSKLRAKQRPQNAEELSPETLIPDVVKTDLQRTPIDDEGRHARIARRAHELAEARGFSPGREIDDWLQAEREIDTGGAGPQTPPENQFTG
ncbi:MAG: DUF2934 domain-containing protein [Povalibacter sp.]